MSSAESPFDGLWSRIRENSGEFFKTSEGFWFTYKEEGDVILPSHSELRIPRSDFELAFPLLPVPPAKLNKFVKGPRFVWAILHDPRISEGRW